MFVLYHSYTRTPLFNILRIIYSVLTTILPMLVLITLSILIHKELNRGGGGAQRRECGGGVEDQQLKRTERRMARVGIVISIVFLVCQPVKGFQNIMEAVETFKEGLEV